MYICNSCILVCYLFIHVCYVYSYLYKHSIMNITLCIQSLVQNDQLYLYTYIQQYNYTYTVDSITLYTPYLYTIIHIPWIPLFSILHTYKCIDSNCNTSIELNNV